jgi:hypothetical protein
MHKKYARDGLVAVSVSVDPIEPGIEKRVLKFLQAQGATFTNLLLDEPPEVWQEKLHTIAVPSIFVFNRQGKWTQFTGEINHEEIEKLVVELLKK